MTFVKVVFVLLLLIPVAILMWNIISRLIADFNESVKASEEQEQERAKDSRKIRTKETTKHEKYGERTRGSHIGYIEKRKRRKERRKRKEEEQ